MGCVGGVYFSLWIDLHNSRFLRSSYLSRRPGSPGQPHGFYTVFTATSIKTDNVSGGVSCQKEESTRENSSTGQFS
jgi:predicted amidohydrolase